MPRNNKIFEKFDKEVMRIVVYAKAASINAHVDCIYPESFAIGILTTGANEVTSTLVDMNVNLGKCLASVKKELTKRKEQNEPDSSPNYDNVKISKEVINICEGADKIRSEIFDRETIGTPDVFLALLEVSPNIKKIFELQGFDLSKFIDLVKREKELALHDEDRQCPRGVKTRALNAFCIDMTQLAKENKLDPIIAREVEIDKAITILCRRGKNNPILLGAPGVGKTAIVEGIAQRIVSGSVPKQLMDNHIYSLSLSSLVAGTKYRGEFEERIQALVNEIQKTPKCILFIDEIHTLVGAGSAAGGALDASNILKPFLARSELRCIGATTLDDFKKYFKKDGALTRRFQQIMVEEPTKAQMYQILNGIKSKFEEYHSCTISDDAVDAIISLTDRFQSDKNFPDKAIDCMDTACAKFVSWGSNPMTTNKNINNKNWVITATEIAEIISDQCEIPIEVIRWDDNERIGRIEKTLYSRVVGQKCAIDTVCRLLKNAYSGVRNPNRPIGSFVFGGESGTGKTYMAKEMSKAIFGRESSFIRLDMTEFSEKHSVSKLIGSPPGYVGFQEVDIFIDKVKRKPYCIVLLDELEKAHPDVIKLFLQVMSDGIMTDATGNKADFKNVILIMTGNFGSGIKKGQLGFGDDSSKSLTNGAQKKISTYCQAKYGSEFINRIDEFIPFMPLGDEDLKKIAVIKLEEMRLRITSLHFNLKFSDDVSGFLVKKSKEEHGKNAMIFDRLIAKEVEPVVSDALTSIDKLHSVTLRVKKDKIVCNKRKNKANE